MRNTQTPSLRARIHQAETLFGVIVKTPAPAVVEMCAEARFDFVVLDSEHGSADTESLEHHVRAAESFGMPVIVRVGSHQAIDILRALDIGSAGILVPHITTSEQAEGVVRAAHYPPLGRRGLATSTRAGRHGFSTLRDHVQAAAENTLIAVQIEDPEALEHVATIAATPFIDVVFLGPTDLSVALGQPGDFAHPDVVTAVNGIVGDVKTVDKAALGTSARDEEDALQWQQRGARFVFFASSVLFAQKLRQVRNVLKGQEP